MLHNNIRVETFDYKMWRRKLYAAGRRLGDRLIPRCEASLVRHAEPLSHSIGRRCCRVYSNAESFFAGCTQLPCEAPTPFLVRILYMIQMGFYIQVLL